MLSRILACGSPPPSTARSAQDLLAGMPPGPASTEGEGPPQAPLPAGEVQVVDEGNDEAPEDDEDEQLFVPEPALALTPSLLERLRQPAEEHQIHTPRGEHPQRQQQQPQGVGASAAAGQAFGTAVLQGPDTPGAWLRYFQELWIGVSGILPHVFGSWFMMIFACHTEYTYRMLLALTGSAVLAWRAVGQLTSAGQAVIIGAMALVEGATAWATKYFEGETSF